MLALHITEVDERCQVVDNYVKYVKDLYPYIQQEFCTKWWNYDKDIVTRGNE